VLDSEDEKGIDEIETVIHPNVSQNIVINKYLNEYFNGFAFFDLLSQWKMILY
jgi:hypothetical protein